jgi:hypothetical protein
MNAAAAKRTRDAIKRRGELISVRRMSATTPQTILNQADVKATVAGYAPVELVNGITQGSRRVIVSRLDLEAAGFPAPPKKGDRICLGESFANVTTIQAVDPDHREYQAVYEISTLGA